MHLCSRVVAFDVGNRLWDGTPAARWTHDGDELPVLLRSCRHGLSSSQYSPTPKPRARMLGGCSVDELRHAATDASALSATVSAATDRVGRSVTPSRCCASTLLGKILAYPREKKKKRFYVCK